MASVCEEIKESIENGIYIITISGTMVDYNGYMLGRVYEFYGRRTFAFTDSQLNTVKLYLKDL